MAGIMKPGLGILLLLTVLFGIQTLITCKKTTSLSLVENIVDAKELKKLCRTRNNVLILFTKGTRQSSELITIFSKAAEEIRGQASLALVDCSGEAKKLCRKLKVSPEPHILKHYKDGEFHKDYDRKHTVLSIVNFLKDPTGDLPWEEDERAKDVLHIADASVLGKLLSKEKVPIMVMFYAPWCGFCKRLKPEYEAVATELKNKAIMAAMDVNKPENTVVRQHFNITGFPTLLYFEGGQMKHKYDGENNREGLLNFMKNPEKQPEKPKEEEWSDTASEVYHLTDENFNTVLESEPSALVMFYAPWCGHCKKMKPEYEAAAAQMKEQDIPGILAAVDAIKAKTIADRFKITGYPTVKYFKRGEVQFDVNFRTADKIIEFMNDPKEPPPPPPPEVPWSEEPSHVVHLKEEDFKPFLKRKKHVLVMFYAPWCGHCKKAKPEFTAAAEYFKDEPKIEFAAVDCTSVTSICNAHDVKGYPTLKYFNYYKIEKPYDGGRTEKDFIDYMLSASDSAPPPVSTSSEDPEKFWSEVPNGQLVNYLKDSTFHQIIQSKKTALVMFYAPWSGHCKKLRRVLAEAAAKLKEQNIDCFVAAVDGTVETSLQAEFSITAYPTLKYFKNGKAQYNVEHRTVDKIVEFVKDPKEPPPREIPWSEEPSNVVHLKDEDFKSFLKSTKHVLVMFYAPWCGHCKRAKPEYTAAAAYFKDNQEVKLAAVDCTTHSSVCSAHDVRGYPTFIYFNFYNVEKPYEGGRTKNDFVKYMESAGDSLKPRTPEATTPPPEPEKFWSEVANGQHVQYLKDATFHEVLKSKPSTLVMFYANWGGHCKALRPIFAEAAAKLKEQNVDAVLAAVDATVETSLQAEFSITAYPTLKYFKNGKAQFNVEHRTVDKIVQFMKDPKEPPPRETPWSDEPSNVVHLKDENFKPFLKSTKHVLVMFYAPWCGHCKRAKPDYTAAAEYFKDDQEVKLAAVDCTAHNSVCSAHDVRGYPTFIYFNFYNVEKPYEGGRSKNDFVKYMMSAVESLRPKTPETTPPPEPEKVWSEVKHGQHVHYLKDSTFHQVLKSKPSALVMFHGSCSDCQTARPIFAEAAAKLKEQNVNAFLAAVNGNVETSLKSEYSIKTYPTVHYFKYGKLIHQYTEPQTVDDIVKFMKKQVVKEEL